MKKRLSILVAVAVWLVVAGPASADLLVDRGLPTANLNNAAGANRSNVQWAFTADPSMPDNRWLVGDDFMIPGSGSFMVDTFTLWSTSYNAGLSLWFGAAGSDPVQLSGSPMISPPITYLDGSGYQVNSEDFLQLYQLDFYLGQVLAGGTIYQFFLDGPLVDFPTRVDAYVHSSNATLSGSLQQGANDSLLYLNIINGAVADLGPWSSDGYGWDKPSDANVRVYGTAVVPEPASMSLLVIGLIGLVGFRRKFRQT